MAAPLVPKFGNHFWFYNGGTVSLPTSFGLPIILMFMVDLFIYYTVGAP